METLNHEKLKAAMIAAGVGVNTLADSAGITPCHISNLIKSDCAVRLPTLAKIAKALNVPAQSLL